MAQSVGFLQFYTKFERSQRTRGLDISRYQYTAGNVFDFTKAYNNGVRFIIMKASGGSTGLVADIQFTAAHVAAARAAGIKVGVYHYTKPSLTGGLNTTAAIAEADFFIATCATVFGDNSMGDLIPFCDYEDPATTVVGNNDAAYDFVEAFIDRIRAVTGRPCGFYSYQYYFDNFSATPYGEFVHSTKGGLAQKAPLWIAAHSWDEYTGVNTTAYPAYPNTNFNKFGGWTNWTVWQYKSDNPDVREGIGYGSFTADLDMDVVESLDYIMAPRKVTGVRVTALNGIATVSWNKNTEVDIVKYYVYKDDVKVGETTAAANILDVAVANNVSYAFKVSAVDQWEEGIKSDPVSAISIVNDRVGALEVQSADMTDFDTVFKDALATGDSFFNPDGQTALVVKNTSGSPITVRVLAQQKKVFLDNNDLIITIPAGKTRVVTGLTKEKFNSNRGVVKVQYSSSTGVQSAAVKFV